MPCAADNALGISGPGIQAALVYLPVFYLTVAFDVGRNVHASCSFGSVSYTCGASEGVSIIDEQAGGETPLCIEELVGPGNHCGTVILQ